MDDDAARQDRISHELAALQSLDRELDAHTEDRAQLLARGRQLRKDRRQKVRLIERLGGTEQLAAYERQQDD